MSQFTHLFRLHVVCPFSPLTPFHLCLKISLLLVLSLPLCGTPSPHLTVKVILIKSSRRTELLIAPRRSSWFQIQIKARCLFPSSSPSCPPFLHLPASTLFHHVKYNLSISRVDCHSLTSASITSQDRGEG